MAELVFDEHEEAKIKVSHAVLQVMRSQLDLQSAVMEGHQRIVERRGNCDPLISAANLTVDLTKAFQNPDSKGYDDARVEMINGLLEVWYKVRPELQQQIINTMHETAIGDYEDPDEATRLAHEVFGLGAGGGEALNEQAAKHKARLAKERKSREAKQVSAIRRRLRNRRLYLTSKA